MADTVSVTQADREAAAALIEWHNDAAAQWEVVPGKTLQFFAASAPKSMREGAFDEHDVVQAFARHRLASTQPAPAFPREKVRPSDEDLDPHLPEAIRSEKRCGIQRSAWMTGWFVPWSPRNDNENAEGPWSHWVALARNIIAADEKALAALTTPKPDASQGEALATQENNHAG